MSEQRIYKILTAAQWDGFQETGELLGSEVDLADGFIHFSAADQVAETAKKHFSGQADLWLLAVGSESLGDGLKWEPSRGGALFPHLYGRLSLDDVAWARPLELDRDSELVFAG